MSVHICPRCDQRFAVADGISDFVHPCNSGRAILDQEDTVLVGNFTSEATGNTTEVANPNLLGQADKLFGSDGRIKEGAQNKTRTVRGAVAATHRQRQHYEFISNLRN